MTSIKEDVRKEQSRVFGGVLYVLPSNSTSMITPFLKEKGKLTAAEISRRTRIAKENHAVFSYNHSSVDPCSWFHSLVLGMAIPREFVDKIREAIKNKSE